MKHILANVCQYVLWRCGMPVGGYTGLSLIKEGENVVLSSWIDGVRQWHTTAETTGPYIIEDVPQSVKEARR